MKSQLRPAIVMFVLLTLVTGVVYPLVVTIVGQAVFPDRANGSMIRDKKGKVVGSELIGQPFDGPAYFWGRPSGTSPFPYNSASSTGSNLGPSNPDQLKSIRVLKGKEARDRFGDQTLDAAIIMEFK